MPKIAPSAQSSSATKNPPSIALPRGNYYGLLMGYSNVWQRPKYEKPNEKVDVITLPFLVTHDATGTRLPHFARVSKIVENKVTYWDKNNQGSAMAEFYSILQGIDCHELVKAIDAGGEEFIPNLDDFICYPIALTLDTRVATAKPDEGGYAYEINQIKQWMPAPQPFIEQISAAIKEGHLVVKESKDGRRYLSDPKHAMIDYIVQNGRVVDVTAPSQEYAQRALQIMQQNSPQVLVGGGGPAAPTNQSRFGGGGAPGNGGGGGFGGFGARPAAPQQQPTQQQPPAQSNVHPFRQGAEGAAAPAERKGFGFGASGTANNGGATAATGTDGKPAGYQWPELDDEVPF